MKLWNGSETVRIQEEIKFKGLQVIDCSLSIIAVGIWVKLYSALDIKSFSSQAGNYCII